MPKILLLVLLLASCAPKPTSKTSNDPFASIFPSGAGLSGRKILVRPPVRDTSSLTGTVVVDLCVNRKGKVIAATYAPKGSNTKNEHLIQVALENARQYRFERSKLRKQCGSITYKFAFK